MITERDLIGVSFVIPVLNNARRLQRCLQSVRGQQYGGRVEVIVVDNGSTDDSVSIAARFADRVLHDSSARSPYVARNLGIQEAAESLVVLLDSNVTIQGQEWLAKAVGACFERGVDVGVPRYEFDFVDQRSPSVSEFANSILYLDSGKDARAGGAAGPCLIVPRRTFDEFGLFPVARSNGDTVWTNAVSRKGGRLEVIDGIVCRYPAKLAAPMLRTELRIGYGNRSVWIGQGHSRLRVAARAIRNMTPMGGARIRALASARGAVWPDSLGVCRVLAFVWLMRVFRGLGRLGVRRVGPVSAD